MFDKRESGILLHVTSLPSEYGIGDTGPWAHRFADFLEQAGQRLWQILPLNPTDPAFANSPYSSPSAFAGNSLLISPERMIREGLITQEETEPIPDVPSEGVDYQAVASYKNKLFRLAYARFRREGDGQDLEKFCAENADWLPDFALFSALKEHYNGKPWNAWPEDVRSRHPDALRALREDLIERIGLEEFLQYLFHRHWALFKEDCNRKGIRIFGDLPIYVNFDSADVWTHADLFNLDEEKRPVSVAGVPPDYFSETGQLWGNPVYRWDVLSETGYAWWVRRLKYNLALFDIVRIDHFRGFAAYWEVPAGERTATNGTWVQGPGEDLFHTLLQHFPSLPIVAEDLGVITQDVKDLMARFRLPGMKLLLFAFGEDLPTNPYAPHNHITHCLVYTGTHDNNTTRGWFETETSAEDRKRLALYLGREMSAETIAQAMVQLAMTSVANTVILPMQDVLGLGREARMNLPASVKGNWQWRMTPEQMGPEIAGNLLALTNICGRI